MAGQKEQVTQTKNKARVTKQVTSDNCHGHLSPLISHFDFWSDNMTSHSWKIILSPAMAEVSAGQSMNAGQSTMKVQSVAAGV